MGASGSFSKAQQVQSTVKAFEFLRLKNVSDEFSPEQLSFSLTIRNKKIHTLCSENTNKILIFVLST